MREESRNFARGANAQHNVCFLSRYLRLSRLLFSYVWRCEKAPSPPLFWRRLYLCVSSGGGGHLPTIGALRDAITKRDIFTLNWKRTRLDWLSVRGPCRYFIIYRAGRNLFSTPELAIMRFVVFSLSAIEQHDNASRRVEKRCWHFSNWINAVLQRTSGKIDTLIERSCGA